MPKYCSPGNKNRNKKTKQISCFNKKSLLSIAKSFNKLYPKDLIIIPKVFTDNILTTFWNKIKFSIQKKTNCTSELCWLESSVGEYAKTLHSDLDSFLRPIKPKEWNDNPLEWLSTLDIAAVLNQYNVYKDFLFIGAVPIDFDYKLSPGICVINELCNMNINKLYNQGIRRIGVIFNYDKHNQSGSHWVSLFISIQNGFIAYFDSYGSEPKFEISAFIHRMRKMMNKLYTTHPLFVKKMPIDNEITNTISKISKNKYTISKSIQEDTPLFYIKNSKYIPLQDVKLSNTGHTYTLTTSTNIPDKSIIKQQGTFVFYNSKRYQFKTSACGMYSIIFIIELLKNKNIYEVLQLLGGDDETEALRDKYFRPNSLN